MHHLLFILVCLCWGSNFLLMKLASRSFGPITVACWRTVLGAATVAILWYCRRKKWPVRPMHLVHILLVVIVGYLFPYTIQPHLINKSQSSGFIGMMVCLVPLSTIIVSIPILRVYPTRRQFIGVLGGLLFFVPLSYDGMTVRNLTPFDIGLAACVPFMYATANAYIKRNLHEVPAVALTLMALSMTSLFLVPAAQVTESIAPNEHFYTALLALLWFGTVGTGVSTIFFYSLVQSRGPLYAGMVTYIIPIVALLWGAFHGEPLTLLQIVSLAGIFSMLALVQTAKPARPADRVADPNLPIEEPL